MESNSKQPWKTLSKKVAYENPWITVQHHDVLNPSGNKGIYGTVHFKNIAVGVIPLDNDLNTWLVGQYRFPLKQYSWEIPEGGAPVNTDPLDSAKRELKEETGIVARNWQRVLNLHTSNSVTDEYAISYLATDLSIGSSNPESCEDLTIRKVPFQEAINMVLTGEITDAFSVATILKAKLLLDAGKLIF